MSSLRTPLWLLLLLAPSLAVAQGQGYTVDRAQSEVRFTVDAPFDSIVGMAASCLSGTAHFDSATGAGTARIAADLGGFTTGISLRDEDLRYEFFDTAHFPNAVLIIQRLERKQPARLPEDVELADAYGTFSIHGVEHVIRVPLKIQRVEEGDHSVLRAVGSFTVKFADYKIPRPTALFLKLGDAANVQVQVALVGPAVSPAQASAAPAATPPVKPAPLFRKGAFVPVAKLARKPPKPRSRFSPASPEGHGEKLFGDASLGALGNGLTCGSCHGLADERQGIIEANSGFVHPSHSLYDVAKRPALWQGIEPTPGKAAALCVRLFMLNPKGLTAQQETELEAFLKANSPDDAVAALDYRALALTRRSTLTKPTGGDAKLGAKLEKRFCESCHAKGSVRPPLTAGLYEPDYLVRRVRWLAGHDAHQMPPLYTQRLTDTDLRHIVTYLAGDESRRIFKRQQHNPSTGAP